MLIPPTQTSTLSDWLNYMQHIHVSAIDMGLSRVLPVAEVLGLLQSAKDDAFVFTVAGTNGKGSTTAVISETCQQAGYKTALYQSPHLIDFNERVRINGKPVGSQTLVDAFFAVEQARLKCELTLSFFEMTTLAAMLIFAEAKCDVWVLEVGLGGRLDVVNIIDADLAVITNIGIDHVDWLGDTREKIGFEKAGILREGIPLIYGEADMQASVKDKAKSLGCTVYQADKDFTFYVEPNQERCKDAYWQFSSAAVTLNLPTPSLSLVNTTTAVAAVLASGLPITDEHIRAGVGQARMTGRFDYQMLAGRHWLFDVAHNERGMAFLLEQFVPFWQRHKTAHATGNLHLIFSMLADKDIKQVVSLLDHADLPIHTWHIAQIDHARAAAVDTLQQTILAQMAYQKSSQNASQNASQPIIVYESLPDAAHGVVTATTSEDLILVCGSFHTIGEVMQTLDPQPLD